MGVSYREAVADAGGSLTGLPGGTVAGALVGEEWVFPLRDLLQRAAPAHFQDVPDAIRWDPEARVVHLGGLALMADTGHVLQEGRTVLFRIPLVNRDGRLHVGLPALAKLLSALRPAWAVPLPGGGLRLSAPLLP